MIIRYIFFYKIMNLNSLIFLVYKYIMKILRGILFMQIFKEKNKK